jgi:hypothetical protein
MIYATFHDLIVVGYFEDHLKDKSSYSRQMTMAKHWLLTLIDTPTRTDILMQHKLCGHGDFEDGACKANTELTLLRATIRWAIYNER